MNPNPLCSFINYPLCYSFVTHLRAPTLPGAYGWNDNTPSKLPNEIAHNPLAPIFIANPALRCKVRYSRNSKKHRMDDA